MSTYSYFSEPEAITGGSSTYSFKTLEEPLSGIGPSINYQTDDEVITNNNGVYNQLTDPAQKAWKGVPEDKLYIYADTRWGKSILGVGFNATLDVVENYIIDYDDLATWNYDWVEDPDLTYHVGNDFFIEDYSSAWTATSSLETADATYTEFYFDTDCSFTENTVTPTEVDIKFKNTSGTEFLRIQVQQEYSPGQAGIIVWNGPIAVLQRNVAIYEGFNHITIYTRKGEDRIRVEFYDGEGTQISDVSFDRTVASFDGVSMVVSSPSKAMELTNSLIRLHN